MINKIKNSNLANFAIGFTVIVAMLMIIMLSHYLFADNVHFVEKKQMRGSIHSMEYTMHTVEEEGTPQGIVEVYTMNAGSVTIRDDETKGI